MEGRRLNYETGRIELTEAQDEFLNWLLGERQEGETQRAWAAAHGLSENTVGHWKRDRAFIEEWEYRLRRSHSHPDVISAHLRALDKKGRAGDVQAIKLYHDITAKMWPQRDDSPEDLEAMSDEQLADLAESIVALRGQDREG